ncbi:MAG: fasciclin domain-containing protein [Chitinophagales bacterium]|nr:fasciclin domain-containing protein [Chitinophagales bacterium]
MKVISSLLISISIIAFAGCNNQPTSSADATGETTTQPAGQSAVQDDVSTPNILKVAVSSKDHTTLVAAVQAAELVDVLSNAGPFTVFAPTNDAFAKLPSGTVEGLLKPEKKAELQNILQYHVWVGVLNLDQVKDGSVLDMVNGDKIIMHVKDGKYMIGDANIVATIRASNGIIHVVDGVLLPPAK